MISSLQGRLSSRRYITVLVLLTLLLLLWRSFGSSSTASYPSSHHAQSSSQDVIKFFPSSYDWDDSPVYFPVTNIKSPPTGSPLAFPNVQAQQSLAVQDEITEKRKQVIKTKFIKAWDAYKAHAWTKDELLPLSSKGKTSLSGWSVQLVDALDTLWIMGLKDEFRLACKEIGAIDWAKASEKTINVFEVTIRYLGGLIGAYELSKEPVLIDKAIELGDALYAAFDTPNRLPPMWLSYEKARLGEQLADTRMIAANGGSLCMEFTRLSQITGEPKYYDATERIKQFLVKTQSKTEIPGLWPQVMNYREEVVDQWMFTIGSGADSLYEYLPKMFALLGGLDPEYAQMAIASLETAREHLLFKPATTANENILMAGNAVRRKDGEREFAPEMQHLTCFAGGMYALAGRMLSRDDFVSTGSQLTAGCVWAYDSFATNIMPEISQLVPCESATGSCAEGQKQLPQGREQELPDGFVRVRDARYLLRPEAIESVFYMWRITGDQVWRDAAWRMWQGIVKETETELAFASIEDVRVHASTKIDSMETFWLAETLKYFYLIFEDPSVLSLDNWVFNTEAHPFKRPGRP